VVQSKLDLVNVLKIFGDLPQNVNFAIKNETALAFLRSNNIKFQSSPNLGKKLSPTDVGNATRPFTVRIECYGKQQQIAKPDQQPQQPTAKQQPQPSPKPDTVPSQPNGGPLNGKLPPDDGARPSNYYEVIHDLMMRIAPSKYSASALEGYPTDYIPKGTIFSYGPFSCTYGSGMYSQTDEVWCRVNFNHDGTVTNGWVSAHFLRDTYGNLMACRYATSDPECYDGRYQRR
jgi:hypothetical protein